MSSQSAAGVHEKPKSLCTLILQFLFGHVGLFLLVSAVAVLGALAFMELEKENEHHRYLMKQNKAKDLADAYNYISSYLWHYQVKPNMTFDKWQKEVNKKLKVLETFVSDAVTTYNYDGTVEGWNYDWTLSKSLLFTISIMTTIGYGHIFPRTFGGQMFTIGYAMIGTPLLLVFLGRIGSGMSDSFRYIYSRCICRWCRTRRYQNEAGMGQRRKRLWEDDVGKEDYMPTDQVQVPIVITMIMIALCLILGAVIFSNWEDWSLSSAGYFSFVTLTTIGFGDMVPGNSFLDDSNMATFKMGVTIIYCLFGMSLISMCIQMMQDQIVGKVRWVAEETGLVDSEARQQQRVRARRTRAGAVPETKEDLFGYRPLSSENRRRRRQKKDKNGDKDERKEKERREGEEKKDREEDAEEKRDGGAEQEPKSDGKAKGGQPDEALSDEEDMLFNMA
ncbi:two pore potassium channel protein sup-9-like [Amphibalanus amphitrite]|uniref:two pore potassium channel protein sup-9-like n=1 Tax=Amphibalanus amphitrite TaxID=1232801 RepID=UPI001C9283E9|nr:two pore potassium channel protein sup-9-like [Amphibalanus amphitrite]